MADGRVAPLEVGENLPFQEREWRVQRAAWVVLAGLLGLGLLGLFGGGPLARATAEAGPLRVDYARFDRQRAQSQLRVELAGEATASGRVEVWVATPYLEALELRAIVPEPETTRAGAERTVFGFAVAAPGEPAAITLFYEADTVGAQTGRVGLVGGPEVAYGQWLFP